MASVSFPFTRLEKLNNVDATIFEGLQIFVNAFQKLTVGLDMVRHIVIAARSNVYVPTNRCDQRQSINWLTCP